MPARCQRLIGAVLCFYAAGFRVAQAGTNPSSPEGDAPNPTFRLAPGFVLEVVAGTPTVARPVAIDWGADGRLWVAEVDDGPGDPGTAGGPVGRVRLLSDTDNDGRFEQSAVFLDPLPCPSGVLAWGNGALICAAPDIIYAEDQNGDGRADIAQRLWVGFDAENPRRRLNSLSLGLDNWIWGSNGSGGGAIRAMTRLAQTALPLTPEIVSLTGHDFRIKPDTGEIRALSGQSVLARTRDDWDNWFGCDAEGSLWQYPLPGRYRQRNPHATLPSDAVLLFRARSSSVPERRPAGFCLNRSAGLGDNLAGSAFLTEPDHGQVRCLTLSRSGIPFRASEASGSEPFLASSDPAFEPVQLRSGPDGALWIVDRGRSPALLSSSSASAAGTHAPEPAGRILRLRRAERPRTPILDLTRLPLTELVSRLDSACGAERDRVHAHLLHRKDARATGRLRELAKRSRWPACRAQALSLLDGLDGLTPQDLEAALQDPHSGVRAHAIRMAESFLRRPTSGSGSLTVALLRLVADPEKPVRYQLALTLGEWDDARAGQALGKLAANDLDDEWVRTAVLTAATDFPEEILPRVLTAKSPPPALSRFMDSLAVTAASASSDTIVDRFVARLDRHASAANEALAMSGLTRLLEVLRAQSPEPDATGSPSAPRWRRAGAGSAALLQRARVLARDTSASEALRLAAVPLLGQAPDPPETDLEFLGQLLIDTDSARLKQAATKALLATRQSRVADLLLSRWSRQPPSVRQDVVGPLIARPEWAARLLDAVRRGILATTEITPVNRERLLTDADAQIRDRAAEAFAARLPDRRRDVVVRFTTVLSLTGDAAKGRATYENLCSRCHAAGNLGANVGPDLSALGSRTDPELLESILDPSATLEPRFVNYQIETDDDRSLSGIVTAEDGAQLTLVQPGGKVDVVALRSITDLRASNLSLMPEGLEQGLTPQDLADVLAFIRSLGR